jgi:hypothetical protein
MSGAISGAKFGVWHPACRCAHAGYSVSLSLSIIEVAFAYIARLIHWQRPLAHITVKRRIPPIANTRGEPMLHRIKMNVIVVPGKVAIITDRVFPIAPLPQRKLAVCMALNGRSRGNQAAAEMSLDATPTTGEIGVPLRQGKNGMEVVRQDHDRVDGKGSLASRDTKRRPKRGDVIHKRCGPAVGERHREEIGSAFDEIASVSDHLGMIPRMSLRSSGLQLSPIDRKEIARRAE